MGGLTYYVLLDGIKYGIKTAGNDFILTNTPGDAHAKYHQDIIDYIETARDNLRRYGRTLDL